ncbi:hypothetical protein L1987_75306 [Smallanthus sonchifolius]|uniref:Uncharacterized protein n=1 Tax=Smallanthus sonchifolius TaxID=185202 RepID=A0ACB9A4D1_9ASTR|nr:hypothetical protein L1987_75306 [Smallanthus sonchifolius]
MEVVNYKLKNPKSHACLARKLKNPQIAGDHSSISSSFSRSKTSRWSPATLLFVSLVSVDPSVLHNSSSAAAFRPPPKHRSAKKDTKKSASSQFNNSLCNIDTNACPEENAFVDQEVERQSAAIRTIHDVEIEKLHTAIRLLKSNISKEQLQIPLLQFFEENLPNLTVSRTEKNGPIEVKWKDKDGDLSMNAADGGNMISYFLQHMSMANFDCSTAIPSLGAGKTNFIGADDLQMKDFVLPEPSGTHNLGIGDFMQTPGVSSGRLSVGMTPKTLRLPKQGEMLLSVHGSPVGVYKENNMDAIHETEEE